MKLSREPLTGPPVTAGDLRTIAQTPNGKLALGVIGTYYLIKAAIPSNGLAPKHPSDRESTE